MLTKLLKKFGINDITTTTIQQTQLEFLGEMSKSFEIKTEVREGDGLSPVLFI